ncbi:MAG: dienelactone hydrolase family protein [Gemmatimonadota bacterium]
MRTRTRNARAAALVLGTAAWLVAVGCGQAGSREDRAAQAGVESGRAGEGVVAAAGGRQESSMPAAILGEAPPPRGEGVRYVTGDEATVGYLAVPVGEGPFPSVILIHEWNGLIDRVRQMADAMADEGYVALAADLYRGRTGSDREENVALMEEAQSDPGAIIANLDAAQRFLRARSDVTGRVATMGWCFGGGVALSYAIGGENHDGTAIFYGRLVTDPETLAAVDHPIYGTFAEMDSGIPPLEVEKFASALREAGIENDLHIYDDVQHGFWLWVDRDPETSRAPALDAWNRLKAYLERVLD